MQTFAIITLDFINDIAHVDGKLGYSAVRIAAHHSIEHTNAITLWARQHNFPVIHIRLGFSPDYRECSPVSPLFQAIRQSGAAVLDTWGCEFHEVLHVEPVDAIVVKHRVSGFYGTALDLMLRARGVTDVVLAGTATNMAIEATARDAHDRDYRVTIIPEACEAASQEVHDAALVNCARFSQIISAAAFLQ